MKKNKNTIALISSLILFSISCSRDGTKADGYGNFEATEISVSAESNGKLLNFTIKEGEVLEANEVVAYIDSIPLSLKRDQLLVAKEILYSKSAGVLSQIDVLNAKMQNMAIAKRRIDRIHQRPVK